MAWSGHARFDAHNYDYVLRLSKPDLAWEFARRNPDLRRAAGLCREALPSAIALDAKTRLYRLPERVRLAEAWGLYYLADPSFTAERVPPFWLPATIGSALGAQISQEAQNLNAEPLDWERLPGEKHILIPSWGHAQIIIRTGPYSGYLFFDDHALKIGPKFFLTIKLGGFRHFHLQLQSAASLYNAYQGKQIDSWSERAFDPVRLQRALMALDIRRFGGSHWDVAAVLFGQQQAERDRRNGTGAFRERARRAYNQGHALMNGGYRRLLL